MTSLITSNDGDEYQQPHFGVLTVLGLNGQDDGKDGRLAHYEIDLDEPESDYGTRTGLMADRNFAFAEPENTSATIWLEKNSKTVRVPFVRPHDARTFQLGRSHSEEIDFFVDAPRPYQVPMVSRFACNIQVEKNVARIYAAGSRVRAQEPEIFVGEHASTLIECLDKSLDSFTSNGVLVLRPRYGATGDLSWTSQWREVSVLGRLFKVRENRDRPMKDDEAIDEENTLVDGTVIDLGGVHLYWRTSPPPVSLKWLKTSFMKPTLQKLVSCAGTQATLIFNEKNCHPCVYTGCGHVVTMTRDGSGAPQPSDICPVATCQAPGQFVRLRESLEPSLFVDGSPLEFCFNPCGHIVNEATSNLWSNITFKMSNGVSLCPFCANPLDTDKPVVKLLVTKRSPEPIEED